MAFWRSASSDGFELLTTFGGRAQIGRLVFDFYAGPVSRFDLGNALIVELSFGTLESVTDIALFGGANALAVESASAEWEIVQASQAELIAPWRYQLTRLGQRGTEGAMANPAPAGARVAVLDEALSPLPVGGGRAGAAVELAGRPGVSSDLRRELRRVHLHACRRRAPAILRCACRAAMAESAEPWAI
jgi:hypothetical protein